MDEAKLYTRGGGDERDFCSLRGRIPGDMTHDEFPTNSGVGRDELIPKMSSNAASDKEKEVF